MRKNIGYFLIVLGVLILMFVFYANSNVSRETRTFSTYTVLSSSWQKYKLQFLNSDGRIVDYSQNGITTSEGQSYGMLRAVWSDDKESFDKMWNWTKDNMQKRGSDHLIGWKWGKLENNKYGFIANGGNNSASDADSDIALALIFAGNRWNDSRYTGDAKVILNDIWKEETDTVQDKRYLIAGNWAKSSSSIIVNPSYFAPYAWRIFAQVDKEHDWNSLVTPGYDLLTSAGQAKLDKGKSVGLPPDWLQIDKKTGALSAPTTGGLKTDYSFDGMRVPWRVALDYQWNKDPQAKAYLESSYQTLSNTYKSTGKLPTSYAHDGAEVDHNENPAMYATALGYFTVTNKDLAKQIYNDKIIKLYSNDTNSFKKEIPYYEQNWLWFGLGIYNNYLQPLI